MNEFTHIELNEKKLSEETLQYILKIQNTYLECTLFQIILDPRVKYGDLSQHIEFLSERLSHIKFFVDCAGVSFINSVHRFTQYKIDVDGNKVDDSRVLINLKNKIQNFSKEIFWANFKEEEAYKKLSQFKSFEDKIISEKRFYSVVINSPFFNVKGWISYYQDLLNLKFPEFSNKMMSGKTIIKYRHFKEEYYLGIETDYQTCKDNFKKGLWEEPGYKLIIFNKLNEKEIERLVTFDKFVHPYFSPPVFSFATFFGTQTIHDINELETIIDNGTRKELLEDGTLRLYNSEEFGDQLKRHAYFYYDMLYHTTKEYIKFIEESFEP